MNKPKHAGNTVQLNAAQALNIRALLVNVQMMVENQRDGDLDHARAVERLEQILEGLSEIGLPDELEVK